MFYSLAMSLLRAITPLIARVTIFGSEHLPPKSASFVGVFNHIGRLDPALMYYLFNRKDIIMMVAEKYRQHAWSRLIAQSVDAIFVDRYNADLNAIREVLRRLKRGGAVVLSPEGTRSKSVSLLEGRDGASYIAAKAGLPVLPVGITGTGDGEVVGRLKRFMRLHIEVHIGPMFRLPPLEHKIRSLQLAGYTEEIMCRIAAELPESYRGIYARHPRVQALLAEKAIREQNLPVVASRISL